MPREFSTHQSKRPGFKPIVFFKGSVEKALSLDPLHLLEAFETAGLRHVETREHDAVREFARTIRPHLEKPLEEGRSKFVMSLTPFGHALFRIRFLKNNCVFFSQWPSTHGVWGEKPGESEDRNMQGDSFARMLGIVHHGFDASGEPQGTNLEHEKKRRAKSTWAIPSNIERVKGDSYQIEFMAPEEPPASLDEQAFDPYGFAKFIERRHVLRVNVSLNPSISARNRYERRRFYKRLFEDIKIPFSILPRSPEQQPRRSPQGKKA